MEFSSKFSWKSFKFKLASTTESGPAFLMFVFHKFLYSNHLQRTVNSCGGLPSVCNIECSQPQPSKSDRNARMFLWTPVTTAESTKEYPLTQNSTVCRQEIKRRTLNQITRVDFYVDSAALKVNQTLETDTF